MVDGCCCRETTHDHVRFVSTTEDAKGETKEDSKIFYTNLENAHLFVLQAIHSAGSEANLLMARVRVLPGARVWYDMDSAIATRVESFDLGPIPESIIVQAVRKFPSAIPALKKPSVAVMLAALHTDVRTIRLFPDAPPDVCMYAVSVNGLALKHIRNQTEHMCAVAVLQNPLAIQYVHSKCQTKAVSDILKL